MTYDIEYSPRKEEIDDKTVKRRKKINKSFSLFFRLFSSYWFKISTNKLLFYITF